ncbi:MAG: hypothetical protein Q9219_003786 [cf. Caloplaca sp. 3 TL-2023]
MLMNYGGYSRRSRPHPPPPKRFRHPIDRTAYRPGPKASRLSPDPYSWLDGSSKAGPSKSDFDILQSTTMKPKDRTLGLSKEEAFALIEEKLQGHVRKQIACVSQCAGHLHPEQKRKLPLQVFGELDQEFFRSVLTGNVSLHWSDLPTGTFSRTICAGVNGNPRIRIELSPLLFLNGSRHNVLAVLLHQMVHAYYLQCCGHRDRDYGGDRHRLDHDLPFYALVHCIANSCEPLRHHLSGDLWTTRQCSRTFSPSDPTEGMSSCYDEDNPFNSVDIQEWRDVAVATFKSKQEAQNFKGFNSVSRNR